MKNKILHLMTDIISFNCNDLKKCISSFKNIVYQFKMMKKGKKKINL